MMLSPLQSARSVRPGDQPRSAASQSLGLRAIGAPPRAGGLQQLPRRQGRLPDRLPRASSRKNAGHNSRSSPDDAPPPNTSALTPAHQNGSGTNLPAAPGGQQGGGPGTVPVQFVVPEYLTHWGQVLKVVGSLEELGNWKVEKAPSMQWNEGHTWTLDVQLPVGAVNFKIVMQDEQQQAVRWEQGDDRSVLIPETTTASGAPVGQVGLTCNFNDVHNSRVEVRPDRRYLQQQLKAVEARVLAIQAKKRKLDSRMAVLTQGIKKYDATVARLEDGVQTSVDARRSSKAAPAGLPQQAGGSKPSKPLAQPPAAAAAAAAEAPAVAAGAAAAAANGSSSTNSSLSPPEAAAAFPPFAAQGGADSILVPILDPADLPAFGDMPSPPQQQQQEQEESAGASAGPPVEASAAPPDTPAASVGLAPTDVSAIKASHVNETVLSATVDQLLAAAEDALARSSPGGTMADAGGEPPLPGAAPLGSAGVDDAALAEEYVEELLAAASALEQQADRRAELLLEAAKRSGDASMAADIQRLADAPMPPIPSTQELAEAAAAAAAIDALAAGAAQQPQQQQRPAAGSSGEERAGGMPQAQEQLHEVAAAPEQQQAEAVQQRLQPEAPPRSQSPAAPYATDKDGAITFSAEDLSAQVDVKQLLAAVLSRVGLPPLGGLNGPVTISATYIPNPAPQSPADALEAAAEASLDGNMDAVAAAAAAEAPEQQHAAEQPPQQQQQQPERKKKKRSPIEAIAAVFTRSASMDEDDGGSGPGGNGRAGSQGRRSSGGGGNGATKRAAANGARKAGSSGSSTSSSSSTNSSSSRAASTAALDAGLVAKQLEAKEAARRAAAERVATALAQVEEVRRSVTAAQSHWLGQPASTRGGGGGGGADTITSASGGTYSRLRTAQPADGQGAPAAGSGSSSSSSSTSAGGGGSCSSSNMPGGKDKAGMAPVAAASRNLPTVGAAAVMAAFENADEAAAPAPGVEVGGVVKEELSVLAALVSEMQKAADRSSGQQQGRQ